VRRRSALVVGLVVLLGAVGTGLATYAFHVSARHNAERVLEQKQDLLAKIVLVEIVQYGVTLDNLAVAFGAQSRLTAAEFDATTALFSDKWLPGALEVSFIVPATVATAPRVQAQWRARGADGLFLSPVPDSPGEHYFPVLSRTLSEGGGGLRVTPAVAEALGTARARGTVTASRTYLLPDPSFVMAVPVYATSPPEQAGEFRGWVAIAFAGKGFLGGPVGLIGGDQVSVALADTVDGAPVTIAEWHPQARPDDSLPARTVEIAAPQRKWTLTVRPTDRLLPASEARLTEAAAVIGGLITLLLGALTAIVVTSRDRALHDVERATADLRHDIERREAVEQQLRRREEELVGFAGVVAHDLRSPLANVTGYAELLGMAGADCLTDKARGYLERLQGSAGRMRELIDDLLAFATADNTTLRFAEIDLNTLVDSVLAERLGRGTATPPRIDRASLPTVAGDPSLIRQVLDNLIGNAIKYTPADLAAEISIGAVDAGGGLCRIEIADRGIGIPEKQREEIFNAFTRADGSERYPGTGLGLAIVQRVVERHGGAVGVRENEGGGSRFWFTLPTDLR
jgi:signal transduction histidine kinase